MLRAHAATLGTIAAIIICAGIARADTPNPNDSPAPRRLRYLNQGSTDSSPASRDSRGPATPSGPAPGPDALWVATLLPLPAGGWKYFFDSRSVSNEFALYVSTHKVRFRGSIVTAWFRSEFLTAQSYVGYRYLSAVTRVEMDCKADSTRQLAATFYSENNLAGTADSEVANPKMAQWIPAAPGTLAEQMVDWACAKLKDPHR